MKYKLTKPIEVGDLHHRIVVDELDVVSISMNFMAVAAGGHAVLSVVMRHESTGWTHTVTYQDEHVGNFWKKIDGVSNVLQRAALEKMVADKRLPEGSILTGVQE